MYLSYRAVSAPSNGALSHGAIAGIVVAVVAFTAAATFGLWTHLKRRFKETPTRERIPPARTDLFSGPRPGPRMEIDTTFGLWTYFTRRFKKTRPKTIIRLACIDQNSGPRPGQRVENDTPAILCWEIVTLTLTNLLSSGRTPMFLPMSLHILPKMIYYPHTREARTPTWIHSWMQVRLPCQRRKCRVLIFSAHQITTRMDHGFSTEWTHRVARRLFPRKMSRRIRSAR
jgi:hypothetical protein